MQLSFESCALNFGVEIRMGILQNALVGRWVILFSNIEGYFMEKKTQLVITLSLLRMCDSSPQISKHISPIRATQPRHSAFSAKS